MRVEVWLDQNESLILVGHLVRTDSRTGQSVRFEYADEWLASPGAFDLDPELMLVSGPLYAAAGADQLAGIFTDCSPDRWGKMLMDRREAIEAREQGRRAQTLRAWDYLLGVHDESRMGALRLRDPETGEFLDDRALSAPPSTELRTLEAAAAMVERGDDEHVAKWIRQLIAPGASLGGARPKAGFRDTDGTLWLAKFPSSEDRRDVGLWEYLLYLLSLDAGIDMPPARALRLSNRGHTYAVKRFDRLGTSRHLYTSAMTRLQAAESDGFSYLDIIQVVEVAGAPNQIGADLEQLFRRVLFNILVGNRDDHLRNHGFLWTDRGWVLSPAFDVNANPDKNVHVLAIDGVDNAPDSQLVMSTADYYRLNPAQAKVIESEIREVVRTWKKRAHALGLPRAEVELMRDVIDVDR